MLREFIVANRELIIARARDRVGKRMPGASRESQLEHGIPIFLTQLDDALAEAESSRELHVVGAETSSKKINDSAGRHGLELLRNGFTVGQVVHGYGDVCQIVTELATDTNAPISAADFQVFNRCLDDAIAGAVTTYGDHRDGDLASESTEAKGALAHELRNLLHTAALSFDVIKKGKVGLTGSTGAMHSRSLAALKMLVERSLAEVRLEAGTPKLQRLVLSEFIEEIELVGEMQADGCGLTLWVAPVDGTLAVDADRQLLSSAVSNLLQNAFKFTRTGGKVSLITSSTADRVSIAVSDQCGGLPEGKTEELFRPFSQAGVDRSGLGLGLSIARKAVRANGGEISVRNFPGTGCTFTIDLPRKPIPPTPIFNAPPRADRGPPEASGNGAKGDARSREPKAQAS